MYYIYLDMKQKMSKTEHTANIYSQIYIYISIPCRLACFWKLEKSISGTSELIVF